MSRPAALEVLRDYERRSVAHVAGNPVAMAGGSLWRGLAFRIGRQQLVSAFDDVVEILGVPQVTPLPGAQPWLLGLANVRGNLLPVADLKLFLEGQRSVPHEQQRMLVVKQQGGNVGVLIDELHGQRTFDESQRGELAEAEGRYAHFIERAYRQQGVTWSVFSMDRLARTPEFRQAAA